MSRTRILAILGGLLAVVAVALTGPMGIGATKTAAGPKLAHMVYFKLKDGSGGNRAKLVASCKLLLSGHEGVEYFSTGSLAGDLNKEFNDRDFDVSLNLVFADKERTTSIRRASGTRSSSKRTSRASRRFACSTRISRRRPARKRRPYETVENGGFPRQLPARL